jgi:TPR repeat protein
MNPLDAHSCQPEMSAHLVTGAKSTQAIFGNRGNRTAGMSYGRAGSAYLFGCGKITQDFEEARYWFELGVVSMDASSTHNLAWMYQNGLGVPQDDTKARQLYQSLIDSSDHPPGAKRQARANLALLPQPVQLATETAASAQAAFTGSPLVPDFEEARTCRSVPHMNLARSFAQSAQANPGLAKTRCGGGNCKSMVDIFSIAGHLQMACAPALKVDYEDARYWFELGDSGDDTVSTHNLAWLYQNGLGVAKDEAKAAALYRKITEGAQFSPSQKRASLANLALIPSELRTAASAPSPTALATSVQPAQAAPTAAPTRVQAAAPPAADRPIRAGTGRRLALVIGNNKYRNVPVLANAVDDASSIATNLRSVGYQVTLRLDVTEKEMKAALRTFSGQLQGGDEVMFFFAGHGVQLGAANYLLPVDIAGESEAQVRDEAIQLQRVLDDIAEQKVRFTLAMIDACRDNPFKGSGRAIGGRGLAPTAAATGQMIIFSAGSGQQALDKLGPNDRSRNGLFTRIFLKEMQKPGVSVDRLVRNVRAEVVELAKSIGHDQVPAIYDQAIGDFYFK